MAFYYYELSENGWEYSGLIDVECDEKPTIVNSEGEYCMIVNGAKIYFDEEIREVEQRWE